MHILDLLSCYGWSLFSLFYLEYRDSAPLITLHKNTRWRGHKNRLLLYMIVHEPFKMFAATFHVNIKAYISRKSRANKVLLSTVKDCLQLKRQLNTEMHPLNRIYDGIYLKSLLFRRKYRQHLKYKMNEMKNGIRVYSNRPIQH